VNSLDRSLVEKAGYDNGWERSSAGDDSRVLLASSRHGFSASVRKGVHEGEWVVGFSEGFPVDELKRGFPILNIRGTEAFPWDYSILCALLRRAAELGLAVPETPLALFRKELDAALREQNITRNTEAERLVKQRIGQGCYREALLSYWHAACALTGLDIPEILRASHAKPWAECTSDSERLNVYNGFLLTANIDALFDNGLISFTDDGVVLLSHRVKEDTFMKLGLHAGMSLRWIDSRHLPFLQWHRENLFMQRLAASGNDVDPGFLR